MIRLALLLSLIAGTIQGAAPPASEQKVLICGVARDVAPTMKNTIASIEALGARFQDYAVIIYENNSKDETAALLQKWAKKNRHVTATCEMLSDEQLAPTRTERIAAARNRVLEVAREPRFNDYGLVIVADLDFQKPWPVDEIIKTVESDQEWDCVTANGVDRTGIYYDRYAFRDARHPLGPEVMGESFWRRVKRTFFVYIPGSPWQPVYSAFGGLAIYKREAILPYSYSGLATQQLRAYYLYVLRMQSTTSGDGHQAVGGLNRVQLSAAPLEFQHHIAMGPPRPGKFPCCEHLPLHAEMYLDGHMKIFVNPDLVMEYDLIMN
jgi:hypothetical protein